MVVVFDFDGVINKSEYFSVKYEREFGVSKDEISLFFQNDFDKCAKGNADIKELLIPYLVNWNWKGSIDSFLNYWFENDISLDNELLSFIDKLKQENFHVVLASQQERNRKNHIWDKLGMKNVFHQFYCTSDLGYLKSDKEFYVKILTDLKTNQIIKSPKEVIFFDDSKNFVKAAEESGIESYHVLENNEIIENIKNWSHQILKHS